MDGRSNVQTTHIGGPGCNKSLFSSAIILQLILHNKTVEIVERGDKKYVHSGRLQDEEEARKIDRALRAGLTREGQAAPSRPLPFANSRTLMPSMSLPAHFNKRRRSVIVPVMATTTATIMIAVSVVVTLLPFPVMATVAPVSLDVLGLAHKNRRPLHIDHRSRHNIHWTRLAIHRIGLAINWIRLAVHRLLYHHNGRRIGHPQLHTGRRQANGPEHIVGLRSPRHAQGGKGQGGRRSKGAR